jgi:cytochrome c oxidase subunit 2
VHLLGCAGPQSALEPAGRDAAQIADLFWWMTGVGLLAWLAVAVIALRALGPPPARPERAQQLVVGLGGVVLPTVLLTVLLGAGLPMLPRLLDTGPANGLLVSVSGEQWWWRVRYEDAQGEVALANELVLPRGRRVPLRLESPDVIHSLWIPSLAGKMDLVPGRTTLLALEPTRTGTFRGACAEYCGASHAHMGLWAVVLEPDAFEAWLEAQRADALVPADALAQQGAALFLSSGCGACHTVRGTEARGKAGPDLTHVGSRSSLAAGLLSNDRDGFRQWLARPAELKPDVRMPGFEALGDAELDALAAYLDGLR